MPDLTLVLYAQELAQCPCFERLFRPDFDLVIAQSQEDFIRQVKALRTRVGVLCFCSAHEQDVEILSRLNSQSGLVPILACMRTHDPDFVRAATQRGVRYFLLCDMDAWVIRRSILAAIRGASLTTFLKTVAPDRAGYSPYVGRMIDEVVYAFPHRLTTGDLAPRLGISTRRLQMICRDAFGRTFSQLMRRVLVLQALTLMTHTNLQNSEIATQLEYSDESSLARIFRKELGYSPTEARQRLVSRSPEGLLIGREQGSGSADSESDQPSAAGLGGDTTTGRAPPT